MPTSTQMNEHGAEIYGGTLDELHPDRNDVILEALVRYETNEDSRADRVLLWFDVAYCNALVHTEGAEETKKLADEILENHELAIVQRAKDPAGRSEQSIRMVAQQADRGLRLARLILGRLP